MIEWMDKFENSPTPHSLKLTAYMLLEEEKQMVVDAFDNGAQEMDDWYSDPSGGNKTSEKYFNETFEQ